MPERIGVEEKELTFPMACDTPQKRLQFTCRAQEKLRYLHNVMSKWTHDGITQAEYDNGVLSPGEFGVEELTVIPDKLKALYPYRDGMSVAKMEDYIKIHHKPRQKALRIGHARKPFLDDKTMIEALNMKPQFDEEGKRDLGAELITFETREQALTTWDKDIKVEDI